LSHVADIAQVLTALGLSLTGLASAFNVFLTWRNGVRGKFIAETVHRIKTQTDGMSAQLVQVTGEAEHAKGVLQGAQEEHDNPR
jgi:hypothetical protein